MLSLDPPSLDPPSLIRVGKLPIAVLENKLQAMHGRPMTVFEIAQELGVNDRYIHRARKTGLRERAADRLACHAGMHPGSVWGQAWWALADRHNDA